jgi:hypothetical protein
MMEEKKEEAKKKEALDGVLEEAGKIPKEEFKEKLRTVLGSTPEKEDDDI